MILPSTHTKEVQLTVTTQRLKLIWQRFSCRMLLLCSGNTKNYQLYQYWKPCVRLEKQHVPQLVNISEIEFSYKYYCSESEINGCRQFYLDVYLSISQGNYRSFFSPPVHVHAGLICIALRLSVCLCVTGPKIRLEKKIISQKVCAKNEHASGCCSKRFN